MKFLLLFVGLVLAAAFWRLPTSRRASMLLPTSNLPSTKKLRDIRSAATSPDAVPCARPKQFPSIEDLRTKFISANMASPAARGEVDDLLCQLRAELSPSNVAAVARALPRETLPTPFGTVVLEAWLAADPAAAGGWIAQQSDATREQAWLVAHALAQKPDALADFCAELGNDEWSQDFLGDIGREALAIDPPAAVSFAAALVPGHRQAHLLDTIAADWMNRDPRAAGAWIGAIADSTLRQHLADIGAQSYASSDPLSAVEWLLAQTPANALPQQTLQSLARTGRETASAQTGAWLNALAQTESPSHPPP